VMNQHQQHVVEYLTGGKSRPSRTDWEPTDAGRLMWRDILPYPLENPV
jgi:hypothetical protein